MRDLLPKIRETGARTVIIGNGSPDEAKGYRSELGDDFELLVDPQLVGYKAMELRRSLLSAFTPTSFFKAFRLYRLGFRAGPTQGDALQLGGVFVITPRQRVAWAYRATGPDDFPPVDDILAAVRAC